jgi:hypothetical protein
MYESQHAKLPVLVALTFVVTVPVFEAPGATTRVVDDVGLTDHIRANHFAQSWLRAMLVSG